MLSPVCSGHVVDARVEKRKKAKHKESNNILGGNSRDK